MQWKCRFGKPGAKRVPDSKHSRAWIDLIIGLGANAVMVAALLFPLRRPRNDVVRKQTNWIAILANKN